MAIRIRTVGGVRIALCAAETDPMPGDVYLDDADHYALAAKFHLDWKDQQITGWPDYPTEWAAMATQKLRDAETELNAWLSAAQPVAGDALAARPAILLVASGQSPVGVASTDAAANYGAITEAKLRTTLTAVNEWDANTGGDFLPPRLSQQVRETLAIAALAAAPEGPLKPKALTGMLKRADAALAKAAGDDAASRLRAVSQQ